MKYQKDLDMGPKIDESWKGAKANDCLGSTSALRSKLWALGYKVSSTNMARFLDMLNRMNDFEDSHSGSPEGESVSGMEEDSTGNTSPLGHLSEAFSSLERVYSQLEERFSEAIYNPDFLDEHKELSIRQDHQRTIQGTFCATEAYEFAPRSSRPTTCAIELHKPKQQARHTVHAKPLESATAPHSKIAETSRNSKKKKSDPVNRYRCELNKHKVVTNMMLHVTVHQPPC
eukprot:jgi/Picsp_1/1473/NSC_04951-R1_---NA---